MNRLLHIILLPFALALPVGAQIGLVDESEFGNLALLRVGNTPDGMWAHTDIAVVAKGWSTWVRASSIETPTYSESEGKRTWSGSMGASSGLGCAVSQTVWEENGGFVFDLTLVPSVDADVEGVFLFLDLPAPYFAGGLMRPGHRLDSVPLPVRLPTEYHLAYPTTDTLSFTNASGDGTLTAVLDTVRLTMVQDNRNWSDVFSTFIYLKSGSLTAGESVHARLSIRLASTAPVTPAVLSLRADSARYSLLGVGGNYCFGIESPVARYTLDSLAPAIARTEMTILEWEPVNDNSDPRTADWTSYESRDVDGSNLRREFELMQELSARTIPFVTSIWHLPAWIMPEHTVQNWPELLESIGSYLLYVKQHYHSEPAYFSFNEPDAGVQVLLTPEEHRSAITRMGAYFDSLGIKTRLLLGDVSNPNRSAYIIPTANDSVAMSHVGALSFHSWGGASAAQYGVWADASRELGVPLFVAEGGVDASAWQGGKYKSFLNGVHEMSQYQQLFLYAQPQGIMYWEYTADYGLLSNINGQLVETERYAFMKHWSRFVPAGSVAVRTSSNTPNVLFTAFRHQNQGLLALHVANPYFERRVTVTGIPFGVASLRSVQTYEGSLFQERPSVPVAGGEATLDLPSFSLTTLYAEDVTSALASPGWSPLGSHSRWTRTRVVRVWSGGVRMTVRSPGRNAPVARVYTVDGRLVRSVAPVQHDAESSTIYEWSATSINSRADADGVRVLAVEQDGAVVHASMRVGAR